MRRQLREKVVAALTDGLVKGDVFQRDDLGHWTQPGFSVLDNGQLIEAFVFGSDVDESEVKNALKVKLGGALSSQLTVLRRYTIPREFVAAKLCELARSLHLLLTHHSLRRIHFGEPPRNGFQVVRVMFSVHEVFRCEVPGESTGVKWQFLNDLRDLFPGAVLFVR